MAAFDRVSSGFPGLDRSLDNIRIGDNVVWQVSSLDDYRFFVEPFAKQAIEDGYPLIYIRFAQDPPLLEPQEGLEIYELDPADGFEAFTVKVHDIITEKDREVFYVFDCLSELQQAWNTDLMMGNFFRVTCPYLFQLDTVAYFPIIRGKHSFEAVNRIRETTQLLLDVYPGGEGAKYLTPLKVWNRYAGDMFSPHFYDGKDSDFATLSDGVSLSKYFAIINEPGTTNDQNLDNWDRFFSQMKLKFSRDELEPEDMKEMCRIMMTKDAHISGLIFKYFRPIDYMMVRDRMIGTGVIGGKACGMLLSRKIVQALLPEYADRFEPHDSYYIGTDVFYTYIVYNDCWKLRLKQRAEREDFTYSNELRQALLNGRFPEDIREQFRRLLDYFGPSPIIVRSSSFLEDGFGNAFAGKYESVFCCSGGDMESRLEDFENAVRTVYASTMDASALEYRRVRGLLELDEQMAVLVQRVSGNRYGENDKEMFFPTAAGVGYSYNAYRWDNDIDPAAGMLRLVMGLGTRAVDRTEEDYPRIISLDKPLSTTLGTMKDRHRFSQHRVDVIDRPSNSVKTIPLHKAVPLIPAWQKKIVLSHDTEVEEMYKNRGQFRDVWFADCQGLARKTEFTEMMRAILRVLQTEYDTPVDIEFTVNVSSKGEFVVNMLQCRPLIVGKMTSIEIPDFPAEDTFFRVVGPTMGRSRKEKLDAIVYIDPEAYYNYPYVQKPEVARTIGRINQYFRGTDKNAIMISPGRIGTSSPELGVPVKYSEISMFSAVCEVAYSAAGYMPELSFGSHMFQDLVEADIFYAAIFERPSTLVYKPELLKSCPDRFMEIVPDGEKYEHMIHVYDTEGKNMSLIFDMVEKTAVCAFDKGETDA